MELRVLGPLQLIDDDGVVAVGGPKERALLAALALRSGHAVGADALIDVLYGDAPPRSATKLLQNQVLRLRKVIGPSRLETCDGGYALVMPSDALHFEDLAHAARGAVAGGALTEAHARFAEALALWRGSPYPELEGWPPARAEVARLWELRRLVEEEDIDARLASGDHARCVADLEALVAAEPLREHRWALLMLALYRSGRQGDALRAYQRARTTLAEDLGVEPGPELRAIEQSIATQAPELDQRAPDRLPSGVVTFLLTDVEGSTQLWDERPGEMAAALAQHDEIIATAIAGSGGMLLKSRGEGDSTFSVFTRASNAVSAALNARDALGRATWPEGAELAVRFAVHTGEAVERDGDYLGPAVNRAARIRGLGAGGQILVSQATAELVRDHLPDRADIVELGAQSLRGLDRLERIFALIEPGTPGRDVLGALCPYPGLRAFQAEDSDRFFGRDEVIEALVTRVAAQRFIAVVGASGSGKSSLVRAGLVPRLAAEGRDVVVITPAARTTSDEDVVVIVDQFEELFTTCEEGERRAFLDDIVARSDPVVIALRADFYGHCAEHLELAELVAGATVLLGPMQPDELRTAIAGPARVSGLRIEPGLVELVLADLAGEPGALPLLSHALRETWLRRRGRTLMIADYRDSGGVRGAIAQTADTVYDTLNPEQQRSAHDIFVRLTELGDGSEDTARRVAIDELAPAGHAADVEAVLDVLADARLVTIGTGTVEVAHEALIREWPRLREWLDADRDGLRLHSQLRTAAREWEALGRDEGALYRGVRLDAVIEWDAATPSTQLNATERAFVDASVAMHDAELASARQTSHRFRALAIGLSVALVIALLAGTLAVLARHNADRQAHRATKNADLAEAARIATLARTLPTGQNDLALLLGVEGHREFPSTATDGGLEAALLHTPPALENVIHFGGPSNLSTISSDGGLLAAPSSDGNVRVFDERSGALLRTLHGHTGRGAFSAAFNRDSSLLASGGADGKLTVWRVADGVPAAPAIAPGGATVVAFFDPAAPTRLFAVSIDGTVSQWEVRGGALTPVGARFTFPSTPTDFAAGSVSPDGRLLAAGTFVNARTRVWDLMSHRQLYELASAPGPFSPDGATLTTTTSGRVDFWDAATGTRKGAPITGLTSSAPGMAFSPDGRRLAIGDLGDNPLVRVYDVASRRLIGVPLGLHHNSAFALGFRPDGRLVTSGVDEAAVWNVDARDPKIETILSPGHDAAIGQFSPDGAEAFTADDPHSVLVWDASTGTRRGDLLGRKLVTSSFLAFSPDTKLVAVTDLHGALDVFDRTRATPLSHVATGSAAATAVAWDPRGPTLATIAIPASNNQPEAVRLWDMRDPRRPRVIRTLAATPVDFPTFAFGPDGHLLALSSGAPSATETIYDTATGRVVHTVHSRFGIPQAAFSPDGHLLAVMTNEGDAVVDFLDTASWRPVGSLTLTYVGDSIAFVDGGARFITSSFQILNNTATTGRIDLWDTATRQPIGDPIPVPTAFTFLGQANAQGTKAIIGSNNGVVAIIDTDTRSWANKACAIAHRNLTRAEWTEYFPDRAYHATCAQWPVPDR